MPPPPAPSLPHRFPAEELDGESSDDAAPLPRRAPFSSVTALERGASPRPPPRSGSSAVPDLFGSGWQLGESSSEGEWDWDGKQTPIRATPRATPPEEEKGRQCCGSLTSGAAAKPSDEEPRKSKEEAKPKQWSAGNWALCVLLETFLTLNFVFVQSSVQSMAKQPGKGAPAWDEPKPTSEVKATKWAHAQLAKFGLPDPLEPAPTALAA